ncbi:predicted protein [Sparassis crispa]|uniref:Uncharacterized protein n=1 Tax=Sparassis crispa TaxID=139825 RepID=A0A401H5Z3_9APHY|nr:predicted protein [Sparassis crispa]GBE89780.1 predicted protein [Sparassis crispa]
MASSTSSLAPPSPTNVKPRRMTSPSLPPPSPLDLPEPVYGHRRPPSPLRQSLTLDPKTGELSDDGSTLESIDSRPWGEQRSRSPTPSVAKFAANIAQRVGSLMSPRANNHLPTDDELEAEAERERERSRREAERIIMTEAEDRRTVEERVLAMLHGDGGPPNSLPSPSRAQTMPATPPSPSSSQKDASWWYLAKTKLTPTKEPLTPAQQIIQETKAREKELEKDKKKTEKMKQKSKEWPSSGDGRLDGPSFVQPGLATAPVTPPRAIPPRPISAASSSPVPFPRGQPSTPPSLAASPLRSNDGRAPPPLYAQFDSQGTLDVPGTLLTIVKRFEKLEKWTVGHVRALEERMDDVERWLVEKDKGEKEKGSTDGENGDAAAAMDEVREELAELQGRLSELGREMAKMITAPGNLSSGPSRNSASITRAPSATSSVAVSSTSIAVRSFSNQVSTSPTTTPPKISGSTSPPIGSQNSRTRLPYPTGDYATPPETALLSQGPFSPPNSPPSSLISTSKTRQTSISGLPTENSSASVSPAGLPRSASPMTSASPSSLPRPNPSAYRQDSMSPTPRKRYTVALGGPIMSASRIDREQPATPHSRTQSREISTAFFSTSPASAYDDTQDITDDSDSSLGKDDTIGKSMARHNELAVASDPSSKSRARVRPQSMYSPMAPALAAPSPVTPLNVRLRSRSTDRFGLGISHPSFTPVPPTSGKFVDPLVVRRQTKEALATAFPDPPKVMPGKPKVPVGQLVAYFDQEKQ